MTLHETAADRANEQEVADVLASLWRVTMTRFPVRAPFDYIAHRGQTALSLVEIKCRTPSFTRYPGVWIDAHKWYELRLLARDWGLRPFLVVRFSDVIAWCDLHTVNVTSNVNGRTDRGDPNDLDLMLSIPREQCNVIAPP